MVDAEHLDESAQQKALQNALPSAVKARMESDDRRRELCNKAAHWRRGIFLPSSSNPAAVALSGAAAKSIQAVQAEDKVDAQSAAQVQAVGDLGDRPLLVLTAADPYAGDPHDHLLTKEQKDSRDRPWIYHLQAQYK